MSSKDRAEFMFLIGRHSTISWGNARGIMRYAATLARLAEKQCNEPWTERDQRKQDRIKGMVEQLCKIHGTMPRFSNDPRGAVVKIAVPDGYTNDWGREGICVPTS